MMKVGINARLLHDPDPRGWNRYTDNLLAGLADLGAALVLYSDRPLHPIHLDRLPPGSFEVRVAPPMRYLAWEQCWLPRACARDKVDVLHSPFNFGLPWSSPCPRVLTLHDAIDHVDLTRPRPDGTFPRRVRTWRDLHASVYHWQARTRADRVIAVSAHAKRDLCTLLHMDANRIRVIPEAADPAFHRPVSEAERAAARVRHRLDGPYVFHVGGLETRKNIPMLVRAFAQADLDGVTLALAGGRDDQRADLSALADDCGMADRLKFLGRVADDDLAALYAEALVYVYPSLYEGFGLQLCEAMAVGCPILAARATSLPEVLGDGGLTFDPTAPDELAALLRRVASESGLRARLIEQAMARSGAFSWSRTAEMTMDVYRELVPDPLPLRDRPCAPAPRP